MLEVRDLIARYAGFRLEDISFAVHQGECLALMGPTGAGKTLLLETILGMRRRLKGEILWEGRDITLLPMEERKFSYLPQDLALFPHLSVKENIGFGLTMRGLRKREIEARVGRVCEMLRIGHLLDRLDIASLSGGEKQRVALARALAVEARMLFLDEPFSSLDASLRYELLTEFGTLRKKLGIAVVFITHDMNEAMVLADRVAVIIDGRIRQVGPPEEVYERPASLNVARLLRVDNLLPVEDVVVCGPGRAKCIAGGLSVAVSSEAPEPLPGERLHLGIRARYVTIGPDIPPGCGNRYDGIIKEVSGPPSARRIRMNLDVGGARSAEIESERTGDCENCAAGRKVSISLPEDRLFFIREDRQPQPFERMLESKIGTSRRKVFVSAAIPALLLFMSGLFLFNRSRISRKMPLRVSAAVILDRCFREMKDLFEKEHADIDVRLDIQPAALLVRMASLRKCDVIAVVDHTLVGKMLSREQAPWAAVFAATEMVLAYSRHSRCGEQINEGNWREILLRDDVKIAIMDPRLNPTGYFTIVCWKLSEDYYGHKGLREELEKKCLNEWRIEDPLAFLSALQSGAFDYAFVPKAHGDDLGLPYLRLPREINCGDPSLAAHYAKVSVEAPDYKGGIEVRPGSLMDFGIAVLEGGNKEAAETFVEFVLSDKGRAILRNANLREISPPVIPEWSRGAPAFIRRRVPDDMKDIGG